MKAPKYGIPEVIATTFLVLLGLAVVLPLLLPWMFVFKTQLEFSYHPWDWPKELRIDNFVKAWQTVQIGQGFLNTLVVCAATIVLTVPPAALAGYVFARYRGLTTEIVFYLVLAGYFVPIQMVLIPLFKLNSQMGLADSLLGIALPLAAFNIPFWSLIYRSFFQGLPGDLAEAATIDGAGHSGTFFQVMLPLAAPATVLTVLLVFIGAWSDYLVSLIMLSNQELFTMQLRVSQFLNAYGTAQMPKYAAAAVIAAAPTLILYALFNRWIIRGTLAGALKE